MARGPFSNQPLPNVSATWQQAASRLMESALFLALSLALAVPDSPATDLPPGLFQPAQEGEEIEYASLAPIFSGSYLCGEHPSGQLNVTGDALGTDCQIQGWDDGMPAFLRPFRGEGLKNEDWFGWHAPVLSPIDGTVVGLHVNGVSNTPGEMGQPPASMITLRRADGVEVLLAHIEAPKVAIGDRVHAGDPLAVVGNNGMSRNPHIHVGAYKDATPLQIRWNLRAVPKEAAPAGAAAK
jgi:hypothetical protein